MTAHGQHGRGGDIDRIGAQGDCFYDIRRIVDGTGGNDGDISTDSLITKTLIHCCKSQFNRDTHIITNSGGCRSGSCPEAVDSDEIRAAAGNSGSAGRHIQ